MAIYTIRVFKAWGARDSAVRWVNNYEVESAASDPSGLGTITDAIVTAEKAIHATFVQFLSATVSTWAPDSHPYNPLTFATIPLTGVGGYSPSANINMLSLNVAFYVKFAPTLGRTGKRFYRACMEEADVETSGNLTWILSTASTLNTAGTRFTAFRTALTPYLAGGAGADKIVLAGPSVSSVERTVTQVVPGGVVVNKANHRYFDRRAV